MKASTHTPTVIVRMKPELRAQLEEFGKKSGIGNLSAVIRFACVSFLRSENGPATTPIRKAG